MTLHSILRAVRRKDVYRASRPLSHSQQCSTYLLVNSASVELLRPAEFASEWAMLLRGYDEWLRSQIGLRKPHIPAATVLAHPAACPA